MKTSMRKQVLVIAALVLTACSKEAPKPTDSASAMAAAQPADSGAAGRAAIKKVRDAWIAAEKKDDAATVAALYTLTPSSSAPKRQPRMEGRQFRRRLQNNSQ